MIDITKLRKSTDSILVVGSHPGIIQSILDFDFLAGKKKPSVITIIASGSKFERYFFGNKEILLPVVSSVEKISDEQKKEIRFFLNVSSGRRVLPSSLEVLKELPDILGGVIFAEDVPELHSLKLYVEFEKHHKFLLGPASVGLLLPSKLKLGAIGGVDHRQLVVSHVLTPGTVAVFSASGGMTNELIRIVTMAGKRVSFALSFGGDRFPLFTPKDAFLEAENDAQTENIIYFGELGGTDEYEVVKLLNEKKVTKDVYCYIGGVVADLFETPPQFGHAKAMAKTGEETARAKRDALKKAGAHVAESFAEFVEMITNIPNKTLDQEKEYTGLMQELRTRQKALITTSISQDTGGEVHILGEELLSFTTNRSFAGIVSALFLGKNKTSQELEQFVDFVLRLLVEHGPYVSGAVNTIVTARAGKDLVSSLASGLLTIGPRFGGAINEAAGNWLQGVTMSVSPHDFVENFARDKKYISGIGHRKYRSDLPDPRVKELLAFTTSLDEKKYSNFALEVEKITVAKKGNLILNVDGAIAAVLLDILSEKEKVSTEDLIRLVETEFFNALFVLSRSVGFIAHFLDQKRLDEGLFRLSDEHVTFVKGENHD